MKPFIVMEVLERAFALERQGRSIIHLEIGEPDFPTPKKIIESGRNALADGDTHYTDSRGTPELRRAIAAYCGRKYGVSVTEDQVIVTMGTSPALLMVLSLLVKEPGDEIILGNPYYPCYPNFIRYLKGTPKFVATNEDEGFQMKPEEVEKLIGPKTRAVMVNSPTNPSGTLIASDDLKTICGLGIPVISDEIYHGLVYGEQAHSSLEFTSDTFVLNGFSKLFAMTGWRLGYAIVPKDTLRELQIMQQNFFISANSFVQQAGVTALNETHPEMEDMIHMYDARRRFLLDFLPELELRVAVEPKGAFYMFVNFKHVDSDSYRLAFDILEKVGVALTPGIDFGDRGEGYLRFSYANSLENIAEGMKRLKLYLHERGALKSS